MKMTMNNFCSGAFTIAAHVITACATPPQPGDLFRWWHQPDPAALILLPTQQQDSPTVVAVAELHCGQRTQLRVSLPKWIVDAYGVERARHRLIWEVAEDGTLRGTLRLTDALPVADAPMQPIRPPPNLRGGRSVRSPKRCAA